MKKTGRAFDPLFTHPYYQAIIKVKEQEFDANSPKIFKASSVLAVQSMMTGTNSLNKSTAHIEKRATNLGITKISTVNNSNLKITDENAPTDNTIISNHTPAQTKFIITPSHDSKTSTTPTANSNNFKFMPKEKNCHPGETDTWSKSSSCARIYN